MPKQEFNFPYVPYPIQTDFMQQLHQTLDKQHHGIFESPTGTGKSLSLICGTLSWLQANTTPDGLLRLDDDTVQTPPERTSNEPDWLRAYSTTPKPSSASSEVLKLRQQQARIQAIRREGHIPVAQSSNCRKHHPRKKIKASHDSDVIKYASDEQDSEEEEDQELYEPRETDLSVLKIYYCSRTHSQLSQFIKEIHKTCYKETQAITLGSRKSLCVNPSLADLTSDLQLTDKCLELNKTKAKCPYVSTSSVLRFRDHALSAIRDIEELADLGRQLNACSYYGTRKAIALAQVVALPYSMLLNKQTRESVGIDVKGNIVICDEAHNLIEAVNQVHSCIVPKEQLEVVSQQVELYFNKYKQRFNPKTFSYLKQLQTILRLLQKWLVSSRDNQLQSITEFLFEARLDNFNLFKLQKFLRHTKLAQKLLGFPSDTSKSNLSYLYNIEKFLISLTNVCKDGRILTHRQDPEHQHLKFLLLNPLLPFREIVDQARSVILTGGTMQPVSDVMQQLFRHIPRSEIDVFTCDHVVPPENLIGTSGPTKFPLEFTFRKRNDVRVMDELGRLLFNVMCVVPDGMVCFFPSYAYEAQMFSRWEATGQLTRLANKKRIYREPREASQTDAILKNYTESITQGGGAFLSSVVGGKMSEGINFGDKLARCVLVVGMPYPNVCDPELKEKMEHLTKTLPNPSPKVTAGQEYYENACMKAVNQSIGRSIRHLNDYSSILLLDQRYSQPHVFQRLPQWIAKQTTTNVRFHTAMSHLGQFFRSKRKQ